MSHLLFVGIAFLFAYNVDSSALERKLYDLEISSTYTDPVCSLSLVKQHDIYKERVNQFARSHHNVIASYPNDNRYCVYYSLPSEYNYNLKTIYRYDAITNRSVEVELPLTATGGATSIWLTKDRRFIFVAAEERYADFIRIDTQTNQVLYIKECHNVLRSPTGFILVEARCINESTAMSMADRKYEYTDYYYDEKGVCTGHGKPYRN